MSGWGRVGQCQETSAESMVSDLTLNSSWRYAQDIRQCPRLSISIIFVLRNRERTMLSSVTSVREWRNIRALKFLQKKGIGEYVSVGEFDGTQSIKSCFEVFFERLFLACWSMISVCLSLFQIKKVDKSKRGRGWSIMIKERLLMIRESRLCWHLILGVGYVGKSEHLAEDYLQPST